jgi:hypothetical protein
MHAQLTFMHAQRFNALATFQPNVQGTFQNDPAWWDPVVLGFPSPAGRANESFLQLDAFNCSLVR